MADNSLKQGLAVGFENPAGRSPGPTAGTLQIDDFLKIKKLKLNYHTSYIVQNPFKLELSWSEFHDSEQVDLLQQNSVEEDKP